MQPPSASPSAGASVICSTKSHKRFFLFFKGFSCRSQDSLIQYETLSIEDRVLLIEYRALARARFA